MKIFRFFLFFYFFLLIGNNTFCQQKVLSTKQIDSLVKKGNQYFKNADFDNSLKILQVALHNAKIAKNDSLIAYACNRIARNFYELDENEKAIQFYERALFHAKNNLRIQTTILINLGNIYSFDKKTNNEKSINFYKKALEISEKTNDFNSILTINMNLAWTYFEQKKFDMGYPFLEYVNKNFDKLGDRSYSISINMLNGIYFSHKNENKKAKQFFLKGIDANNKIILKEEKQTLYLEYSKFLYKTGEFEQAYKNLKMYNLISDSLFNKKKVLKAIKTGINLENDAYKFDLEKMEIEKKSNSRNLVTSKIINILALIITFILILLLFSIYRNSRLNKLNSKRLLKKNFQLKVAIDKSNESSKTKSQFVSTVSHELRTPLYGVIGITDIIYDEHKELIDNKHLDALRFSARYLLSLVNDILQINKIEESKITLDRERFNLVNEIESIRNSLQFIATKNNIIFTSQIDPEIPKIIISDQMRLSQILMNLITNALKFTKNGEVKINLSLEKMIDEIAFVKFEIIDTGIGISKVNQEKIFDKFTQIERKEQDYQGTGLGLSIVKRLLYLFKTEIHLESEEEKGSKFTFTIGFLSGNHTIEEKKSEIPTVELTKDLRILVVEDNKINQLVTKKIMEQNNHFCKLVSSGIEAIEVLKIENFDVILMDINMPVLNGFETTEIIRKMKIDIPIIALTAYNRKQVMQQAKISRIDAVIIKPFESSLLFNEIQNQLDIRKSI